MVLIFPAVAMLSDITAATEASYQVTIDQARPRYATVQAQITPQQGKIFLNDAAADTGLYHGWATFVHSIKAFDADGNPVEVVYLTDGSWRLSSPANQEVTLHYQMLLQHDRFPNDPGDDELAYAQPWGVMWTGRALFISGADAGNIEVAFDIADNWRVTTPWQRHADKQHTFKVDGNRQLLDAAFMAGTHDEFELQQGNAFVRLGLGGESVRSQADFFKSIVTRYLDQYGNLFGGPPSANMVLLASEGRLLGGGVMGSSISMLFDSQLTQNMLPLAHYITTHEMYHLWNANFNYENLPELYWFTEGFAEYATFLTALRGGDLDQKTFLVQLAGRYQNYHDVFGDLSMAEAGAAKLDHYDLIYSGGMLAALALDINIREQSSHAFSLNTLHQYIYANYSPGSQTGLTNDELISAIQRSTHIDTRQFFERYIKGTSKLPIDQVLLSLGLMISKTDSDGLFEFAFLPHRNANQLAVWQSLTGESPF